MTNRELFNQDPITKAVDKCNLILKEYNVKVSLLKETYIETDGFYTIRLHSGKIVSIDTYDKFKPE